MSPEEQLQVVEAVAETLKDSSPDVRKEAFHCLVSLGLDGLGRMIDVIDDQSTSLECKCEALQAIGGAFAEGKVDKTKMVKVAIKALEDCLDKENDSLSEAAVVALGEIGTQAITTKPKLLALLSSKKENNRLCVKISSALLHISPIH